MKEIKSIAKTKFDFKNKMYICVSEKLGILVLKHFTLKMKDVPADCLDTIPAWRWISMDGREFFNTYINEPLYSSCAMERTPQRAFDKMVEFCQGKGKFYVCNGLVDFIKNAYKIMKLKKGIQEKTNCVLFFTS